MKGWNAAQVAKEIGELKEKLKGFQVTEMIRKDTGMGPVSNTHNMAFAETHIVTVGEGGQTLSQLDNTVIGISSKTPHLDDMPYTKLQDAHFAKTLKPDDLSQHVFKTFLSFGELDSE